MSTIAVHTQTSRCLFGILLKLRNVDRLRLSTQAWRNIQIVVARKIARDIEQQPPRHYGHGARTAHHALRLGRLIGFQDEELHALHLAALLHDIGLLTLPSTVLGNPAPLNEMEYALVQSHPRAGAEQLQSIGFLHNSAVLIAHHHERWDGCGYPYGIRGTLIPLGARILAVADTFDSLTSVPAGRPVQEFESALRLLELLAGSQLDPHLVEIFTGRWTRG